MGGVYLAITNPRDHILEEAEKEEEGAKVIIDPKNVIYLQK